MAAVASRDLRNHTADVLRKVAEGERITITVNGRPVAEIVPLSSSRRESVPGSELIVALAHGQADPAMRADLAALTDAMTDELDSPS